MCNRFARSFSICLATFVLFATLAAPAGAAQVVEDIRVAVLPFKVNAGPDLSYLKDSLPELLTDRLKEAGFDVVPQAEIVKLLQERGIESIDVKTARELALLLGSGFSVYGDFNQLGDSLNITASVVEAFGSDVPKKVKVTKDGLINLLPAVDALVNGMSSTLLQQDVVAEVDVEGTKVLDKEVVLMRVNISKGDVLTAKQVNAALKNVYNLGYFEDVKIKVVDTTDGKKVVFSVVEKPRIQALGVRGASAIDADDILEAVSTKKGGVVNPKVLSEDIKTVREMYRKEGYYKASISHELEKGDSGQARLNFIVDEGPKLYVEDIVIDGAKQLDPDDIKDMLALKERGMFSWITNSGVLKEELLERDAAAIMAFYNTHGFIDVKVGRAEVEINDDGIKIIFKVWEGPRYKMGKTTFKGDLIDSQEKLAAIVGIDDLTIEDEYFNRSILQSDVKKLTEHYNNYGYAYADVGIKLNDDKENLRVDVEFNISKHQKVHIRRVLIEGNTSTRDNVILREMRLADGDMFSGKKLRRSSQRLDALGYFEKVDIQPVPTGNPDEMDLLVKVKDKPTGKIGGGIGYSTYDSVYFGGEITETNLFGKGYTASFKGMFSGRETSFIGSFINPKLYDSDLGLGIDVHNTQEDLTEYNRDGTGGGIRLFYPIGEYTSVSWGYALDYYEIYDITADASQSIKDDKGSHILSVANVTLSRDTRNTRQFTSAGTKWTGSIYYGGGLLGGTDNFVKYLTTMDWWKGLFGDLTFHWRGHVGYVHENLGSNRIPADERFYLGGINSVRGYSNRKISADSNDGTEVMGGDKEFFTNFELMYPINDEYGVQLVTFFDAGGVWKEGEMFFQSINRFKDEGPALGLYKGVGGGIRWYSPLGPLRLEYGYGLDKLRGSGRHKIEFMMGQEF